MSPSIGSAYHEAVEFSRVLPSHALVRFRDVLEEVCISFAKHAGLDLVKTSIAKYITQLWDSRVVTSGLKSKLNKIRVLCNEGAHQVRIVEEGAPSNPLQQRHEILVSNAVEVRGLMSSVFEEVYRRDNGAHADLNYKQVTIESQEWKDVIYAATMNEDPVLQYKAGLWCEAEIDRRLIANIYPIVSDEFAAQQLFLQRLAATYFRASFEFVPNIDASFRYASLVLLGKIDGDKVDEARALVKAAADSGHGEACQFYGSILYDKESDYEQALKYLLLSERNEDPRAYFCLWSYYSQGKACEPQIDKALAYLQRGCELDCCDALYALGREYFEGEHVPKDVEKASELLQRSAELGNGQALGYKKIYVDIGYDKFVKDMQESALEMLSRIPVVSGNSQLEHKPKAIDPYSPCPCNSGKKFRFCCMKKSADPAPSRGLRYISL